MIINTIRALVLFNFSSLIGFVSGILVTLIAYYVYRYFIKIRYGALNDISKIASDDTLPLYTLINNLPDHIYIKDIKSRYIIANDKFAQQLKLEDSSQLIGKKDDDIYPEEQAKKYLEDDKIILSGKEQVFRREQKSEKDGKEKVTVTTKIPLKNKYGKIIGLVGIFSDITEQYSVNEELKRHHIAIEKERNLLRTLIDSMPDAIYIKDTDGRFLDVNPTQIAVSKAGTRDNMLNKTDYDFYPKDIADIFSKDDKSIIKTGKAVISKEEIGFDIEGNIRVVSTTKVPFYHENGDIAGLVGIGRDITKLKETEEKLIEQAQSLQEINVLLEERQEEINQQSDELNEQNKILESERTLLRTLIDNIPDFIYIKDVNANFITANKYLLETLKIKSLEELTGKSDFNFFPKEMAQKFFGDDQEIIRTGIPKLVIEETGLDKFGNIIHVLTTKVPFRNADGEVEGIVGIGKDITALKETQIKLEEQADYLKEANVLLEERQEEIEQQSSELSSQNKILENERNLLRVLIDSIPEAIFIKDTECKFITVNKTLMDNIHVKSVKEVEGKTDFDFYDKKLSDELYEDEINIFKTKKPLINKEEIRMSKDGKLRIKSSTKVPYFDEDGRLLGLVGISKDITELKQYQEELQKQADELQEANQLLEERSEEIQKQSEWVAEQNEILDKERSLLRTLIDYMPDYIYIKDLKSRFITVNQRMLKTLQIKDLNDIIGKTDFDVSLSQVAAKQYFEDEQQIFKTGQPLINKEEIGFDEYGKERVVSTTKVPFHDAEGNILGIVGIGRDITKQKNNEIKLIEQADSLKEVNTLLEERQEKIQLQSEELNKQAVSLRKTNKQLEELNATKNKFFSIIAHDLKNPFQAIFGFSELLMRNFEDFEEKQRIELLSMIKTSSESAYNLLENLLQWARTQTDRIKYNPAKILISELIEQNIALIIPNAEKKGIQINSNIHCSGNVWADYNMINLVIRNLLSNAVKFTGINGNVSVECKDISNEECLISISDNGIGITEENIKKLYRIDEYFSTSGTAGETGTGLGLIICKEFIEKNKGVLKVESEIDAGTTFLFTLPRKSTSER